MLDFDELAHLVGRSCVTSVNDELIDWNRHPLRTAFPRFMFVRMTAILLQEDDGSHRGRLCGGCFSELVRVISSAGWALAQLADTCEANQFFREA
jgi:hypothetical protein